jgi:3-oxoacyl-[acyl-carrier-protein] synthase II
MSRAPEDGRRRAVITGIGPVTPVGIGVERFFDSLVEGRSGVGPITAFDAGGYPSRIAAEVRGFRPEEHLDPADARRMERFAQLALAAARLALADAALDLAGRDRSRVGCVIGTGIGGIGAFEAETAVLAARGPRRVSPRLVAAMIPNMAAGQVAIRLGITGPSDCTTTACAAGAHAIARAVDLIRSGRVEVCLAGGTEAAVTPLTVAGFAAARALSARNDEPERASRPFDRGRDGFVIGEGAAVLVLEEEGHARARGARIYAEVAGVGLSSDAHHETAPHPEGEGAALAMRAALDDAGIAPGDVGYVNAHGTSTPLGDVAEARAIDRVFGRHAVAVSATKSTTGHLLGAAGAVEAAATALALARGVLPPTINLEDPDPDCDLDHVACSARRADVRAALSNCFGFGGCNASLALVRPE